MSNVVVISFANEAQVLYASHKLDMLDSYGDITVYEKILIRKYPSGETALMETDNSRGIRTYSGLAIGAIVGAFVGPVGFVVGMVTGMLVGMFSEKEHFTIADDFDSKAIGLLQPGSAAVIAELDENDPATVDSVFAPLGASIWRSKVEYVRDRYVEEEVKEVDDEISAERAKMKSAAVAQKTKIQQRIAALKEKRRQRISRLHEKLEF